MKKLIKKIILLGFYVFNLNNIEVFSQVDSGFVEVKNAVLFYRVWGNGEPIVFLNGGPGYASNGYEVYATGIEKNRKVILFDQRGTGKSTMKRIGKPIYMSHMVDDLEALRKHLKIEKWDVFGHSFGGEYALNYIHEYPKSIDKVILSATPGLGKSVYPFFQKFKNPKPESLTTLEIQLYHELLKEKEKRNPDYERMYRISLAMKARFYVSKPENYAIAASWWLNKANPNIHAKAINNNISGKNKSSLNRNFKQFTNNVLIIHGIGDFLNLSHPYANQELFPNAELIILQDAGHMMSIDSKEEYFNSINKFLDKTNQ